MASNQPGNVLQFLRRMEFLRNDAGATDGQLLELFIQKRDGRAFEALVGRHASMVWGVCRRILTSHHDAEDAFQATFVVLLRKARSISPRGMVGNWLYGVAYHTALKARALAKRRRDQETSLGAAPEPASPPGARGEESQGVIDEELNRLPAKYRAPIILCDVRGITRKEAAQHLGWPEGTLSGRLFRAREVLAKRLTRRGLTLSAGSVAMLVARDAVGAAPPLHLLSALIQAANLLTAGTATATGAISASVAGIAEGVLRTMWLTKIKTGFALVLLLTFVGGGAWLAAAGGLGGEENAIQKPKPPIEKQEAAKDKGAGQGDKEAMLLLRKEKLKVAESAYKGFSQKSRAGQLSDQDEPVRIWSKRWLEAEIEIDTSRPTRLAAVKGHLQRMKDFENWMEANFKVGKIAIHTFNVAQFARIEAEIMLRQAEASDR